MSDFRVADPKSAFSSDKISTKYSDLSILNFDNYSFKLLIFRSKIKQSLDTINSTLLNGVIEPNDEDDFLRRVRRSREFASRFSRNFTYPMNRNVEHLRRFQDIQSNKIDGNFMRISIHLHHLILQALDKFSLQLPNMVKGNGLPDYMIETFKIICEVCSICCGVEIDTNNDCQLINLLNDIENYSKKMIVKKQPIFYRQESPFEKKKRFTPRKPKNMLEMYMKKPSIKRSQSLIRRNKKSGGFQVRKSAVTKSTLSSKNGMNSVNSIALKCPSKKSIDSDFVFSSQVAKRMKKRSRFDVIPRLSSQSWRPLSQSGPSPSSSLVQPAKTATESDIETIMHVMRNRCSKPASKMTTKSPSKYFIQDVAMDNRYELAEVGPENAKLISIKIRDDASSRKKLERYLNDERKKEIAAKKESFGWQCSKLNAYRQMESTNAWNILARISDRLADDLMQSLSVEFSQLIDENVTEILLSEIR